MPERLHSEQYIINKVFDPINNTLRVETETAVVLSGVTISTSSTVNQGNRGPEPWIVSGLVTVSNPSSSSGGVVIQGNSTGAPWIVSGTVTVANPTTASSVLANQGARGPEPWPVSGTVVISNVVPVTLTSTTVNQGQGGPAWIVSGTVSVGNTITTNATVVNQPVVIQGNSSGAPWIISGITTSTTAVDTFTSLTSGVSSVQGLAALANRRLLGFSITETAVVSAPAEVILHHGTSNAGTIIDWVKLAANENTRDWYGDGGLGVPNGVYVNRNSGSTQITLFHRTEA